MLESVVREEVDKALRLPQPEKKQIKQRLISQYPTHGADIRMLVNK
jgi:hypothetical protein